MTRCSRSAHDDARRRRRPGCPARAWSATPPRRSLRVHTDTRTLAAGDLFVALQGRALRRQRLPRRCARRAARSPRSRTAASTRPACRASRCPTRWPRSAQLAAGWRAQFELPLVAVTGSNGKTTVTQMIAAILRAWLRRRARSPPHGNFNNDIGVPLTLLRLRARHQRRGGRAGHEPPRRDRAAGRDRAADRRAGQQRAARAPGVHGQRRGGGARERRGVRGAAGRRHRGVPADDAFTPLWTRWRAKARAPLPDLRRHAPMPTSRCVGATGSGGALAVRGAHAARRRATCTLRIAGRAQRAQRAGGDRLRARRRRAARRDRRGPRRPSSRSRAARSALRACALAAAR